MIGSLIRFTTALAAGGAGAVLIAANWLAPNDPVAGSLIGILGTVVGWFAGLAWANAYQRKARRRGQG